MNRCGLDLVLLLNGDELLLWEVSMHRLKGGFLFSFLFFFEKTRV